MEETKSQEVRLNELENAAKRIKLREIAIEFVQKLGETFCKWDIEEMRADIGKEIEDMLKFRNNRITHDTNKDIDRKV